jgi:heptosyltransferase-2
MLCPLPTPDAEAYRRPRPKRHKVLIVKLGYSETLVPEIGNVCSLGDVFRTTVLLHLHKDDHVTWLTDAAAVPLLEGNPYIDRILTFDLISTLQLLGERYDVVINLEKIPGICSLVSRISAWRHYGFRFDEMTGDANAYENADEALAIATQEDAKRFNFKPWAQVLFSMLGAQWSGESYILGYKPAEAPSFDLGFNSHVGTKLPTKAWPERHWKELQRRITGRWSFSPQRHLNNLRGYIDWIASCRVLITCDSLGLHLGVALGRKVLALMGPTSPREFSPHANLRILTPPGDRDCVPCSRADCRAGDPCMDSITPAAVLEAIEDWM